METILERLIVQVSSVPATISVCLVCHVLMATFVTDADLLLLLLLQHPEQQGCEDDGPTDAPVLVCNPI